LGALRCWRRRRGDGNPGQQGGAETKNERKEDAGIVESGLTVVLHRVASGQRFKMAAVLATVNL
jgi:hypothetical protein